VSFGSSCPALSWPDDLKFLFRGEKSMPSIWNGFFSELENGRLDYNPQLESLAKILI